MILTIKITNLFWRNTHDDPPLDHTWLKKVNWFWKHLANKAWTQGQTWFQYHHHHHPPHTYTHTHTHFVVGQYTDMYHVVLLLAFILLMISYLMHIYFTDDVIPSLWQTQSIGHQPLSLSLCFLSQDSKDTSSRKAWVQPKVKKQC